MYYCVKVTAFYLMFCRTPQEGNLWSCHHHWNSSSCHCWSRGYVKTPRGLHTLNSVWVQHLSEEVRRFYKNWCKSKKAAFTKYAQVWQWCWQEGNSAAAWEDDEVFLERAGELRVVVLIDRSMLLLSAWLPTPRYRTSFCANAHPWL